MTNPTPDHGPPTPPEGFRSTATALRLRLWIGAELRDEVWLDASDPNAADLATLTTTYHQRITDMADAAGVRWLVEVYNPELPEDQAYRRFGTDTAGMVAPVAVEGWATGS